VQEDRGRDAELFRDRLDRDHKHLRGQGVVRPLTINIGE
jgi:hypothetical protein